MTAAEFQRRRVHGINLAYASLAEWLALVCRIGGRIARAQRHYDRCRRLYRSLSTMDIRASCDRRALAACERLFDLARGPGDISCGRGLQREFSRAEIGALLVETRNRFDALRSGRASHPRERTALRSRAHARRRARASDPASSGYRGRRFGCGPNAAGASHRRSR